MSSEVTLKEIAEALGVSAMTVSRAINNSDKVDAKTKERVLKKAESMGYTPNHVAKSLVSRKTQTIGVVLPEIHHIFFSEVVSGIEAIVYEKNYQLFLTNSAETVERERNVIEALRSKRVDGLLISCAADSTDIEYYKGIVKSGLKLVFFDRCVEHIGASCVGVNDAESARKITRHLIEHGYETIAHLSAKDTISIGRDRKNGYIQALEENDMPVRSELIIESGLAEETGYQAMKKLLEDPGIETPRAIMAVNDPVAFGAVKAITEHGLSIPDDIAITGFSNDIRAELMPSPLTTIMQPAYDIGRTSAEKLIRAIETEEEPVENIYINTELIIRESCGCNQSEKK